MESSRAAGLFVAVLGVSAAIGLSVFWLGGPHKPTAAEEASAVAAEEIATPAPKAEDPATAKVAKAAPKRKTKITWQGGGDDSAPSGTRAYVGSSRPYYTGGAVNQPGPPPRFPQFKTTRERLPDGRTRITLYRTYP